MVARFALFSTRGSDKPQCEAASQRSQEDPYLVPVCRAQRDERITYRGSLPAVAKDCLIDAVAEPVVHESTACPYPPERDRPHFVSRARTTVLDNSVAGPDVMQQEITVGVNLLVAERLRNSERAAVRQRPGCGRGNR